MLTKLFGRSLLRTGGVSPITDLIQARFSSVLAASGPVVGGTGQQDKPKRTRRKKQHRVMKEGPHITGLHQLCALSPELSTIVGAPKASRVDITKKLWGYIKSHNLQEETDKRNIKPDAALGKELSSRIIPLPVVNMCTMQKYVQKHVTKIEAPA
ncbi:conserved hypothetical protein [Perkinsus marinus ATCC 50983]|uniref:DM2 domain-containing protein n=1 Tax=Perkinsus marinus (strain ATCC 50983 / TXsc) TaxID=423536 RepID=C5LU01_PERM5|nr:conserved hypothetical protein [Perkinsus marinus ATCC 50983]EEQ99799.1 conserved hypothetical protein [Perkinsus marinus ATCC 50983]|eukprot:XP_002767082.1 conserved hypothetical protein [Perkinsus marinus ATCC 50983]